MESHSHDNDLTAALVSLRPTPRPEFAARLDARAAEGFPRRGRGAAGLAALASRLRAVPPRRMLAPAGALAATALVVATAIVATSEDGSVRTTIAGQSHRAAGGEQFSAPVESAPAGSGEAPAAQKATSASSAEGESGAAGTAEFEPTRESSSGPYASHSRGRDVERSAAIVLGAEPADVRDDAAQVFEAVHAARGIVLNSSIRDGAAGEAGARFELLIPAAKVGDAMASFSSIAAVVSRHESTLDITAPTVGVSERLEDSDARVHSLLDQLAAAESESERAAVEAELRAERSHQAALRSRLSELQRRANLSHVSLRIETGDGAAAGGSGAWGVGDGFDAAGRILAVAAGVVVIGMAILAPFALIVLLAWLAHRAWLRRARANALG